jgi:hypothetical protein
VADGPVRVGDRVLVIGKDYAAEGGLYGDVHWKKDAYHALNREYSIFVETSAGHLVSIVDPRNPEYGTVSLEELREALGP